MTIRNVLTSLVTVLLCVTVAPKAHAVTVQWQGSPPPYPDAQQFLDLASQQLSQALGTQKDFARGMGNASAYSAQAATLNGYQNYDAFAVMGGPMVGIQAPSLGIMTPSDLSGQIAQNRDIFAGVGVGAAINVGINAGALGLKLFDQDLYFNVKYFSYTQKISSVTASVSTFGAGVNYGLIHGASFADGLAAWRGLSIGLGVLYNSNDATVDAKKGLPGGIQTANLQLGQHTQFGVSSSILSIPVDIVTSVQLLYILNVTLGFGLDFNSGQSNITIKAPATVLGPGGVQVASILIDASTNGITPDAVRARMVTGVGLNFGPVKIDLPVTWYFSSGVGIGLSAGVVW